MLMFDQQIDGKYRSFGTQNICCHIYGMDFIWIAPWVPFVVSSLHAHMYTYTGAMFVNN